jgi:hypothetical protein
MFQPVEYLYKSGSVPDRYIILICNYSSLNIKQRQ